MINIEEVEKFFSECARYCIEHDCKECSLSCCVGTYERSTINPIIEWSQKNPILRNPTWREWQKQKFPHAKEDFCPRHVCDMECKHIELICNDCLNQVMPNKYFKLLGGEKVPVDD